ncbi:Uncharacterised protein [Mycobacteroides abscessus]|nr:Uncharacterised protein [Mycobacteroides abscessus]
MAALREADIASAITNLSQLSKEPGAVTGPLQRFDIVRVREAIHARQFHDQLLGDRRRPDKGVGAVRHMQKER